VLVYVLVYVQYARPSFAGRRFVLIARACAMLIDA
jgi:hypothetical protein